MENLDAALNTKKLADLKSAEVKKGSNLIEPTKVEIESIIVALKAGKSYQEIKKTIRRSTNGAKLGFSFGQIKEIDQARMAKVRELTPVAKEVV